jgi:type III pantothenate kinase
MSATSGALIVVDFGTATTFDVVDADGDFVGGVIAPGANLSAEALHQAAARCRASHRPHRSTVIGRGTVPPCSPASIGAMSA